MFPQTVWPHTGVLTVTVKARCSIEVVSVAFGIFPVNVHTKWLLWNVRVHFDCEGSHIIIIVIVIVTVILILILIIIMIIIIISIIIIKGGSAMPDALNCHRRKFRSQTSDNMDRWKAEMGRVREEKRTEENKERISKKRKSPKKEDPGARKGRKVAKHCVFPMICGSEGSKSRLAKAAGAEPSGQMRDEKLHAVVARSTFPSQSV